MLSYVLIGLLILAFLILFLSAPPDRLAWHLRNVAPLILAAAGMGLIWMGARGFGGVALAGAWLLRSALSRATPRSRLKPGSPRKGVSILRSAMFSVEIDHKSGAINGIILAGEQEGRALSSLDESELLALHASALLDSESASLLEAYLDRRVPGWREDANPHPDRRTGGSHRPGSMTKQEAYEILGLASGASSEEISEAHRRLMKRMHPDGGGSTFIASRLNEAREILLR